MRIMSHILYAEVYWYLRKSRGTGKHQCLPEKNETLINCNHFKCTDTNCAAITDVSPRLICFSLLIHKSVNH